MKISAAGMFGNSPRRDAGFIRSYAECLEGLGFHALHVPEHVVFFASYESLYPYSSDGSANWGRRPESTIRCSWSMPPRWRRPRCASAPGC